MSNNFASAYLRQVKSLLDVRKDEELARILGAGKSTIATWRQRGNIPDDVFEKVDKLSGLSKNDFKAQWFGSSEAETLLSKLVFYTIIAKLFRSCDPGQADGLAIGIAAHEGKIRRLIVRRLHEKHGEKFDENATIIATIKMNREEYITLGEVAAIAGGGL